MLKIVGCWISGLSVDMSGCQTIISLDTNNFHSCRINCCEASGCCSGEGHNVVHGSGNVEFGDETKQKGFSCPCMNLRKKVVALRDCIFFCSSHESFLTVCRSLWM